MASPNTNAERLSLALAIRLALGLAVVLSTSVCRTSVGPEAGFWFDGVSIPLDAVATHKLGGPVTYSEGTFIAAEARAALQHAFDGIPLRVTDNRDAFWRVRVRSASPVRHRMPVAGETRALGRFGAWSDINVDVLAHAAITYAPEGASRDDLLRGIGRGIGHTAAHELAHAILGPSNVMDRANDEESYEFRSFARPEHFYGTLHWNAARPALLLRLSH